VPPISSISLSFFSSFFYLLSIPIPPFLPSLDSLALIAYVYGLDNNTMYAYLQQASNDFDQYLLYTTLAIIQQVIIAVAKLPVAKLSDVFGRAEAFTISLFFYVIGFIVIAAAQNMSTIAGGIVLYAIVSHLTKEN